MNLHGISIAQTIQSVAQDQITTLPQLIEHDPLEAAGVFIFWGISFLFIFYIIIGKQNIPQYMISIVFLGIAAAAFFLTIYISPETYQLASANPVHFIGAVIASALFGIILIPAVISALLGFAVGRLRMG